MQTWPPGDHQAPAWGILFLVDEGRGKEHRREAAAAATPPDGSPSEGTVPLVMVVDDDPDTQDIYSSILEHAGFAVIVVADGAEAVRRAQVELPDVILMDIDLPGLDGWEATRRLKAGEDTREIPVVGISASAGEEFRFRAMTLGFESYHAKPFLPTRVLAEVRRALGLDREA